MKKILHLLLLVTTVLHASENKKILIITHAFNRPDFIDIQNKMFKKFLNNEYEFVVFNDARDNAMRDSIANMCVNCGIRCIRVPQEIHTQPYLPREKPHDPLHGSNSVRHANCIQYSLDTVGFEHEGIVLIVDSDAFLIRPLSLSDYMKDKDISAFLKRTPKISPYLCPIVCLLNMSKLPDRKTLNFNCGTMNGWLADTGGWTHYYLIKHPEVKVHNMSALFSHQLFLGDAHIGRHADNVPDENKAAFYPNFGFNDTEIKFLLKKPDTFEFYLDNKFLHYRGGSTDTSPQSYHYKKFCIFMDFINEILK